MTVSTNKVMARGYAVMAVAGILTGATFGRVWLSLLANGFPEWRHQIEISGWIVLTLFVVMGGGDYATHFSDTDLLEWSGAHAILVYLVRSFDYCRNSFDWIW